MPGYLVLHRRLVTALAAVIGLGLVAWAAFVSASWGQGVLINVGTSLLLLAPLFYLCGDGR